MTPIDYNNPNEMWRHNGYDPYKGMSDDERMKAGCLQLVGIVGGIIVALLICALFGSCTTTKYIPVENQHTEHHWHTDSVHEKDSVIREIQTTIMELDSAEMARYGIRLKSAERAWLVKSQELERQIQQLMQLSATKDSVRDSVPVPYPVEVIKEVPAKLTWWQKARLHIANIALLVLLIMVIYYLGKWHIARLKG